MLHPEPIEFNGATLTLSEERPEGASKTRPVAPPPQSGGMFVPRAAVSRPRAGLGSMKRVGKMGAAKGDQQVSGSSSAGGKGQDDFRKMLG